MTEQTTPIPQDTISVTATSISEKTIDDPGYLVSTYITPIAPIVSIDNVTATGLVSNTLYYELIPSGTHSGEIYVQGFTSRPNRSATFTVTYTYSS